MRTKESQFVVLTIVATEEITVTQSVRHRPIKCHSRSWSQRCADVNGSHHDGYPCSQTKRDQTRDKTLGQAQPPENIGNLPALRRSLPVRTTIVSTVCSMVLPVFHNIKYKLQRRLSLVWCAARLRNKVIKNDSERLL